MQLLQAAGARQERASGRKQPTEQRDRPGSAPAPARTCADSPAVSARRCSCARMSAPRRGSTACQSARQAATPAACWRLAPSSCSTASAINRYPEPSGQWKLALVAAREARHGWCMGLSCIAGRQRRGSGVLHGGGSGGPAHPHTTSVHKASHQQKRGTETPPPQAAPAGSAGVAPAPRRPPDFQAPRRPPPAPSRRAGRARCHPRRRVVRPARRRAPGRPRDPAPLLRRRRL